MKKCDNVGNWHCDSCGTHSAQFDAFREKLKTTEENAERLQAELWAMSKYLKRSIEAMEVARDYSQIDGAHHKAWVIDQMVRVLAGDEYAAFVKTYKAGEDGPDTYDWDEGVAP